MKLINPWMLLLFFSAAGSPFISKGQGMSGMQEPSFLPPFSETKTAFADFQRYRKWEYAQPDPAQKGTRRKSLFAEAGGNGGLASVNFDIRFLKARNDGLGFRVGLGVIGGGILLPLSINYILGGRKSGFESGIGITPFYYAFAEDKEPTIRSIGVLNLGYRLQPVRNGVFFRINWSPVFDAHGFNPAWAGLSLGYSFR